MPLTTEKINEKLKAFTGWGLDDTVIWKTYGFQDFMTAIDFVNKVAVVAEHYDHHPEILIQYSRVTLSLSTHSEGGVTDADFALAKELEQLAVTHT